jgi:putative Holliday junction resolvase
MTGRVLGIDPGTVRIGLALSDPSGVIASPLSVLTRRSAAEDMAALRTLVAEHEVERVVIGLPRLMDGRLDQAAAAAQEFGTQLARATGRPVEYWDERLTTVAAERYLVAQGKRRRQRRAEIDRMAAALLLQSYLDYRGRRGSGG